MFGAGVKLCGATSSRMTDHNETPCPCGGTLRPIKRKEYDASVEIGIPLLLTGDVLGLGCENCGAVAIPGRVLEAATEEAVELVLRLGRLLSGREAKFLRKAALGLGQEELANKLGLSRPTVARWEAEKSLSAEHDFELRGLVLGVLLQRSRSGAPPWSRRHSALVQLATDILPGARSSPAPDDLPPLRIAA